ncbi:LOW QUALITY PROTEIN: hypothetical protein T265_15705 [Opisthorchis viverrini]|uniref:MULE transposase domain-containing protein n=1 Tax=Opisthorchis viverrini TaxID=6198 RepID=A0A074ZUW9_OPIVI|nr:LOW QUALITY PROTEIN: hypothetical protein T265_15705 [Opisthorchis viverrini]KER19004.1 LOW QUALITY PROTEIN: hypothetical protein T265_15705 [Opisthorchis viverrini]
MSESEIHPVNTVPPVANGGYRRLEVAKFCNVITTDRHHAYNPDMYGDLFQAYSTYQCNRGGYHMWHVVIADCNGVVGGVSYSFIRNESQECYDVAVEHFMRITIVVDKNRSQLCSLRTAVPDATVIFCSFHVIQSFSARIHKLRNVTHSDKEILFAWSKRVVHRRELSELEVYATSIRSRNQGYWSYLTLVKRPEYLGKHARKHAVTLGNETTNRGESANRYIKWKLTESSSFLTCVQAIINRNEQIEAKYRRLVSIPLVRGQPEGATVPSHLECLDRLTPYAQNRVRRNHSKTVELAESTPSYLLFRDGNNLHLGEPMKCSCSFTSAWLSAYGVCG